MTGPVEVSEKPDILWDKPHLERLYARLEDEYELKERVESLNRKLAVIAETAQVLTDIIDTRRSLRLEVRKDNVVAIGLIHGKTNWVKNVLAAGEADIRMGRKDLHLINPRLVPAGGDTSGLPRAARAINRRAGVLVADIG